jgi:hypothetical protein
LKAKSNFLRSLFIVSVIIVLAALVFTGCPDENGASGGTITVKIINAGDKTDKDFLFCVLNEGGNIEVDDPVAWGGGVIAGGTAEDVAEDDNGDVIFTDGEKYDIYAFVDDNGDGVRNIGEMAGGNNGVEVDGDITVTLDYNDFT